MIRFEHVSFSYPSGILALDDVCLHIETGEFVCILGGNGSGKSTLSKHINALLTPGLGEVTVCGLDTTDARQTYAIRSSVGMVFQNPEDQLVASPVENEVAFGPENMGIPSAEIRERVTKALESTGLAGFEQRETASLSGGQKQRLAIAGALAMNPKILVLDEASAMLDPKGRADLMGICTRLHARGMTIVMITHSMEEAACAQRAIIMDAGRIVAQGSPTELLCQEDVLRRLQLEPPFPARLALALRARGADLRPCVDEEDLIRQIAKLKERSCSN